MKKTNDVTYNEEILKELFRDYRKMTPRIQRVLESQGFTVIKRKHWILNYKNHLFTLPSSASDHRSGMNFYCILKRTLNQ